MIKPKLYFFLILVSLLSKKTWAQSDSIRFHKRWTISTDIVLNALNEHNIQAEVKINPRISLGVSLSNIKPFKGFFFELIHKDLFIADQEFNPGRVYQGFAAKAILRYYAFKSPECYIGILPTFKILHYDTAYFNTGKKETFVSFARANENTLILGADFLLGADLVTLRYFYMDFFTGIGYRYRMRKYTTFRSEYGRYNYRYSPPPPLGDFSVDESYLSFILGIRVGFCYSKR